MIFLENKYRKWYDSIICAALSRTICTEYTERHHIVPKCLFAVRSKKGSVGWLPGDPDAAANLVQLTAREHFICHLLLTKIVPLRAKARMTYALWCMSTLRNSATVARYNTTSRMFEFIRRMVSTHNSGAGHSQAKIYQVVLPNGETKVVDDLKAFCKKENLSYDLVCRLARRHTVGLRGPLKGWSVTDMNSDSFGSPFNEHKVGGNRNSYHIVSPTNEEFTVVGALAHFCTAHNLDLDTMQQICRRQKTAKKGTCKGWHVTLNV